MAWQVFKLIDGKHEFVGEINEPADCMGDDLYTAMEENEWISSIDDYEVDGDSQFIAVMHKDDSQPDIALHFFEWEQFTRRTDEPKLSWLENKLDEAGIFHRRNGESFHAPITEIAKHQSDEAWKILDPVDDIPDNDEMFKDFIIEE